MLRVVDRRHVECSTLWQSDSPGSAVPSAAGWAPHPCCGRATRSAGGGRAAACRERLLARRLTARLVPLTHSRRSLLSQSLLGPASSSHQISPSAPVKTSNYDTQTICLFVLKSANSWKKHILKGFMILSWHYLADHKVRGAEVVRPLRDAVDFVYAGERDWWEAAQELARVGSQSLGRH